jgi:hypothetical protein
MNYVTIGSLWQAYLLFYTFICLTAVLLLWIAVRSLHGWFSGIFLNVVTGEEELSFLRLVSEMQALADRGTGFVCADAREADDEPVEEHLRSLYSKETLRPRHINFSVRLALHLKGEFTTLEDTQANRLVLRKSAVDYCRGRNVRRVHIATHVPLAVELALIPLTSDLTARKGGKGRISVESKVQVFGSVWHWGGTNTWCYQLFGFRPLVKSKEPPK